MGVWGALVVVAALVGLAPFNDDSGNHAGPRQIRGGRSKVRAGLYQAAIAAIRHCPRMKAVYAALKARGKASRIAIMRAGRLVQYERPEALLARPADAFVQSFVGADRALKRLALLAVADYLQPASERAEATQIPFDGDLRDALAILLGANAERARVVDQAGTVRGVISLTAIRAAALSPGA